jgi:hypothetical protein
VKPVASPNHNRKEVKSMTTRNSNLPNWPDELLEIINNALALATEESIGLDDAPIKSFCGDNFDVSVQNDMGFFRLSIYPTSIGLEADELDIENPLLSLTIRPHVWWINELKRLNSKEKAVAMAETFVS